MKQGTTIVIATVLAILFSYQYQKVDSNYGRGDCAGI